ncbi:MAG TPA: hypothetical protein PK999_07875, partial [Nitrospira sp.]|nr:hypothetical protein [Nitrospira sp.]HNC82950.1 hypothetical protein [Nitrospira sp.]HNG03017.1 hypothetical protein [Nitrospira sp.]HNJ21054.1 hypothetical protein [Nitrospira sp.]HNP41243.1 hypothetical protein [Nitrospira sp.]
IVPMFTWGFRRSNFAFAMIHSFSQNSVFPEPYPYIQVTLRNRQAAAQTSLLWSPRRESNA